MKCVFSENVDDLMQEIVELRTNSRTDRPEPLQVSPTLASRLERPDKAHTVKVHRSCFKAKDGVQ